MTSTRRRESEQLRDINPINETFWRPLWDPDEYPHCSHKEQLSDALKYLKYPASTIQPQPSDLGHPTSVSNLDHSVATIQCQYSSSTIRSQPSDLKYLASTIRSSLGHPTSIIRPPPFCLGHPTSSIRPRLSDLKYPASTILPQYPDLTIRFQPPDLSIRPRPFIHPASTIRPQVSGLDHSVSVIQPQVSGLDHSISTIRSRQSGLGHPTSAIRLGHAASTVRPYLGLNFSASHCLVGRKTGPDEQIDSSPQTQVDEQSIPRGTTTVREGEVLRGTTAVRYEQRQVDEQSVLKGITINLTSIARLSMASGIGPFGLNYLVFHGLTGVACVEPLCIINIMLRLGRLVYRAISWAPPGQPPDHHPGDHPV
ncbi:hypothetical protein LR48_Vigan03g118200 [Vigna angularis]|uniref:Uncharacterized protein n=1 Tax=Phaseolus angularis TaxID=3914 RepID=A0A0L9U4T5_PHAAN|nr:hypothetical protein LR48_Vigan03g118200 [Vigna angularis]